MMANKMKVTALVDRFGSNRMNAQEPAKLLQGCTCIHVPFVGGFCEVAHFAANIVNVNDLDKHAINLGRVVQRYRASLVEMLDATLFHPDSLADSQAYCRGMEKEHHPSTLPINQKLEWAYHYYVCSWMTRGGKMGSKGQFEQGLSVRWKSTGGDSVKRFRNATEGLIEWEKVMQRCTFHTLDAFDFIAECKKRDIRENGIYCDPPWPEDGKNYTHGAFDELVNWDDGENAHIKRVTKHEVLARMLSDFKSTRIVVRYGDHPLVRDLYKPPQWTWRMVTGRTQANSEKAEVLLTNF